MKRIFTGLISLLFLNFLWAEDSLLPNNILINPSFEFDWMNNHAEGHVLTFRSDFAFNSSDLKPDYWGARIHTSGGKTHKGGHCYAEKQIVHSGTTALRLKGEVRFNHIIPLAVKRIGGGGWSGSKSLNLEADHIERFPRDLTLQFYYRAVNLTEKASFKLTMKANGVSKVLDLTKNTATWTKANLVIKAEEMTAAMAKAKKKGLSHQIVLDFIISKGADIILDDISLSESREGLVNELKNSSFEEVNAEGYPSGWSPTRKYDWRPAFYYRWTDWSHWFNAVRGKVSLNELVSRSGNRSLQMNVLPGDEVAVVGPSLELDPKEKSIVEIGAYVMANRVKWLDIRAMDAQGKDLPTAQAYEGGWRIQPDFSQFVPSNTQRWIYVRKFFQVEGTMKSIRPKLCARGFNGLSFDDAGKRPNVVQCGVLWWDDIRVIRRTAAARNSVPAGTKKSGVKISVMDPGDRLFGDNRFKVTLKNHSTKGENVELRLRVAGDQGKEAFASKLLRLSIGAGAMEKVDIPYRIDKLWGYWKRQAHLHLEIKSAGRNKSLRIPFNTWPEIVDLDMTCHYVTPKENPQLISVNFGVAQDTLKSVKKLVMEIRRRRDDGLTDKKEVDLQAGLKQTLANIDSFPKEEFGLLSPVFSADKARLLAYRIDLSKLPVHSPMHPVRDHYIRFVALDAQGKELFSEKGQYFGRVAERKKVVQPKIVKTEVGPEGAILINGKPTFMKSDGGYPTARGNMKKELMLAYGFNSVRWVLGIKKISNFFKQFNLYSLEAVINNKQLTPENIKKWQANSDLDGAVTLAWAYEGSMAEPHLHAPHTYEAHKAYHETVKKHTQRLSNYGVGGAHNVYTMERADFYDTFGAELEPLGPPRFGLEMPHVMRKKNLPWFHLAQAYDNTPYEVFRFDHYFSIVQGARGFSLIQGLGDFSFYRGLNGEIDYISPFLFSGDKGAEGTSISDGVFWLQRRHAGKTLIIACQVPPVALGKWEWSDKVAKSGKRSHTGESMFAFNPKPLGLKIHGYRHARPMILQKGDVISQWVCINPKDPPAAIAWGPRIDAKWNHNLHMGQAFDFAKWKANYVHYWAAGELLPGTWQISMPGQETKYNDWYVEHILPPKSFTALGALPKAGEWHELKIDAENAGLVGKQLDGFMFLAKGGRAWWDDSAVIRDGKRITLCDDHLGPTPEQLTKIRVNLPWAKEGQKVKVLFEERELTVKNGGFNDDFSAEDFYKEYIGAGVADTEGWLKGDKPKRAQSLGYAAPKGPVSMHVYQVD